MVRTYDLCAKAPFLNMKLFDGDFGCQFCKEKGENIVRVHVYPYTNNLQLRTSDESIEYGKQAFEQNLFTNILKLQLLILCIAHT